MSDAKVGYPVKVEKGRKKVFISSFLFPGRSPRAFPASPAPPAGRVLVTPERGEGVRAEFVSGPGWGRAGRVLHCLSRDSQDNPRSRAGNPRIVPSPPWSRAPPLPCSALRAGHSYPVTVGFRSFWDLCPFPPGPERSSPWPGER